MWEKNKNKIIKYKKYIKKIFTIQQVVNENILENTGIKVNLLKK